jgi:hypothetical protein
MGKRREGKRGPAWTAEECQREFTRQLPRIRAVISYRVRAACTPAEWEEAKQEGDAIAWQSWVGAWKRGKDPRTFPTAIGKYAARRILSGRSVSGRLGNNIFGGRSTRSSREQLAPIARGMGGPLPLQTVSYLLDNHRTPPPDQAAFRIDFPAWLSRLSYRMYRQAVLSLDWKTTKEIASILGLTAGAVSQGRRTMLQSWEEYTA